MHLDELSDKLEAALISHADGDDASHDIFHARRVKTTALAIVAREGGGDDAVLIAAAYLHDLVNLPKDAANRAQASSLSASAAAPILRSLGFADDAIAKAQHAIVAHSFSANVAPTTIEAKALQDADRMEAVGAIGLARVFYIAGRLGRQLFDGNDPFAVGRALDDRTFAVDHFAVKLLGLGDTMQTETGRQMARERVAFLHHFLAQLGRELGHPCEWPALRDETARGGRHCEPQAKQSS